MVDEAAAVLEAVADDSWISWGAQVLPNVVARVKNEGSESVSKAVEPLFAADVEKDANEVIAPREARRQEKLEALLDERISQEEFERDSEGDAATAERSEATGDEELVEVETQISGEMDVDSGEDELVSVAEHHPRHPRPYGKGLALLQEVRRWWWQRSSVRSIRLVSGVRGRG